MRRRLLSRFLLISLLFFRPTSDALSAPPPTEEEPPRSAILADDWEAIATHSSSAERSSLPPASRALTAHAFLLLNRNNEALKLFLSLDDKDLQAWKAWTQAFAGRHPGHAVAHYLAGDAAARSGDLAAALQSYDVALSRSGSGMTTIKNKNRALVLIAKGTVLAQMQRLDEARVSLDAALENNARLADNERLAEAHASMGNLMLIKRAYPRALSEFTIASKLSKGHVLALNGIGCASYGAGQWESAEEAFAQAAEVFPLPLFAGNRRALLVAAENVRLPGMDDSPLFRVSDFLDWPELRARSTRPDDIMRAFFGRPLPEKLSGELLAEINVRLEDPAFSAQVRDRIDLSGASSGLLQALDGREAGARIASDAFATSLVNRLIMEHAYPGLIARHTGRNPGTQLTLTRGLVDQMSYKQGLTSTQIIRGQANMDYFAKPFANALSTSDLWPLRYLGDQFKDHITQSTATNRIAYAHMTGRDLDRDRVSGVTASLRRAFIEQGPWPVLNWFGLGYVTPMEPQK